jgi:putative hydrolase of the HAD superfamily
VIRAVLFDLDGTLLNRRRTYRLFLESQLERFTYLQPLAATFIERGLYLDENGYAPRHDLYEQLAVDLRLPPEFATELLEDFWHRFPAECVPFPDLGETLDTLRTMGLRLGLITNGFEAIQGRKIDGLGIRPLLDAILISESVGSHKPDAAIFLRGLELMEARGNEAVFVGDNPETDIAGAKGAGMKAIWRRDEFFAPPLEVDGTIDDLGELPEIVAQLGG